MHNYTNQRDGSFGLWFVSDALTHCCLHRKPKGRFLWFVSGALIHCCLRRNMPKACPYVMTQFAPSPM